jgi:serine/threonine-protein kinase HipA
MVRLARCLRCYGELKKGEIDYHLGCCRKIFGTSKNPFLNLDFKQIKKLASEEISNRVSVPGVQPKLSLGLSPSNTKRSRLTFVSVGGQYVLKPPFDEYPEMPEIEHLTMQLAVAAKIRVAENALIRLSSGELAYITKRFDRIKLSKLAVEDLCQLTENLTENKYYSSTEKISKTIDRYSTNPGIDQIRLFKLILFCYLTGNADMHLKNFSLITENSEVQLSPAYDLVATKLLIPSDEDELALPLNGKKRNLTKKDFLKYTTTVGIQQKAVERIFSELKTAVANFPAIIERSFISSAKQVAFISLINRRIEVLS